MLIIDTLLIGSIPGKPAEPVAWVHKTKAGGRVFYTSLGHAEDFKQPAFNELLKRLGLGAIVVPRKTIM